MRPLTLLACAVVSAVCTGTLPAQEYPKETIPSRRIIDEIRAHRSGLAVWWTGHNGWLIKSDDVLISTDLLVEARNRLYDAPVSAAELAGELDISFCTHYHGDHFNLETSRILAEQGDCMFVLPANCLDNARRIGIPEDRIRVATPRESPFEIKGVRVQPIRALHGHTRLSVYKDANMQDCGYLITIGGKTFLQPGDSVLLQDHMDLGHVNVLFFSPTEHNMHIQASAILINELEPDYILPQHRATVRQTEQNRYWTHGYPREVRMLISESLRERYHILEMGGRILID